MKSLNNRYPLRIAVIGSASCDERIAAIAAETGALIADRGAILICGGRGGVMEAACRGALEKNGITIGILPGNDPSEANTSVLIPLATGLGHARNAVIIQSADAVIAISGSYGTLSEIGLALKMGKPVFSIESPVAIDGLITVSDPIQAVSRIFGK